MAEVNTCEIADAILAVSQADDEHITNLKLQKLLYYAQGWYLAEHGRPLFDDPIESWVRGPVVPSVSRRVATFTWVPNESDGELTEVSRPILEHLQVVWDGYGRHTGRELEAMTHRERPWLVAREGLAADDPSDRVIELSACATFFHERRPLSPDRTPPAASSTRTRRPGSRAGWPRS